MTLDKTIRIICVALIVVFMVTLIVRLAIWAHAWEVAHAQSQFARAQHPACLQTAEAC